MPRGRVRTKLIWVSLSILAAACLTKVLMLPEQAVSPQSSLGSDLEESQLNMKLSEYDLEAMIKAIRMGKLRSQDLVKVG
jgi:hypothetical protein